MASIYVSPINDFNAGRINGVWIDLEGKSFDEVQAEIRDTLKCDPTASDEWVIRDYEGFEGIRLDVTEDLARVVAIAEALEEHGEAFAVFWEYQSGYWTTVQDAIEDFEESYLGWYDSLGEYAQDYIEGAYDLPTYLKWYIDWDAIGRDFVRNGDIWTHASNNGLHVFRNS